MQYSNEEIEYFIDTLEEMKKFSEEKGWSGEVQALEVAIELMGNLLTGGEV